MLVVKRPRTDNDTDALTAASPIGQPPYSLNETFLIAKRSSLYGSGSVWWICLASVFRPGRPVKMMMSLLLESDRLHGVDSIFFVLEGGYGSLNSEFGKHKSLVVDRVEIRAEPALCPNSLKIQQARVVFRFNACQINSHSSCKVFRSHSVTFSSVADKKSQKCNVSCIANRSQVAVMSFCSHVGLVKRVTCPLSSPGSQSESTCGSPGEQGGGSGGGGNSGHPATARRFGWNRSREWVFGIQEDDLFHSDVLVISGVMDSGHTFR
uniref:Uncharacterized protein n=1 Tax=Daphnia galeata TaxID=27404 RepID=A0A8J2SDD8_9CRUS|nr:unnamed protein product [Daphnia galeata]